MSESDQNADQLLGSVEEFLVFPDVLVDFDEFGSCQQLHDHGRGDERRNSQLHEGTPVGGQDDSHPVEGIGVGVFDDAVEGDLAAEEVDEDDDGGPDLFGFLGDLNEGGVTVERGVSISGMTAMAGLIMWRSLVPSLDLTMGV